MNICKPCGHKIHGIDLCIHTCIICWTKTPEQILAEVEDLNKKEEDKN